ncbi:MAG TPA: hypothetical protein VGE83_03275, partial [Terracidiphilus sp.]
TFHNPGATQVLEAWESGYVSEMDTTQIGWAVQRLGAGREKAGESGVPGDRSSSLGLEPVDPHAGILFHARRGARVLEGQPIATLYATTEALLPEPIDLLKQAIHISPTPPEPVPLVTRIFTRETAEAHLRQPPSS